MSTKARLCDTRCRDVGDLAGRRRRPAFTLVELLVVVSIIALLISILLPSLRGAREQAKMTKCVAHMRGAGQAAMSFATDHNDRFQVSTDEVGVQLADAERRRFEYGKGGELLSWPVAIAQGMGITLANNWDWGVRATSYTDAIAKENLINDELEVVVCPSDRVRVATPFYPRNKPLTYGSVNNDGLRFAGDGDPDDPTPSSSDMSYWGNLSFGINEDLAGVEVAESRGAAACWRAVSDGGGWTQCKGEFSYPPFHPCGASQDGWRLQGRLDKVYRPGDVGFLFDAGRDDERDPLAGFANLILSAGASGPYLGDFQQFHRLRMPTKRHPKGRVNVLFADMHGGAAVPVAFNSDNGLPERYSLRVRVSPYPPRPVNK